MAYFIFNNNSLFKISSNDTDRSNLNIIEDDYIIKNVSDENFNDVKLHKKTATLVNDSVVITDMSNSFLNQKQLEHYFKNIISAIDSFLGSNENHPMFNDIETYKSTLEVFDTSSITYPYDKSWEEYCNDNSITFISPLQIP